MNATVTTGALKQTLNFDGAERIYPCRCGKTHRGDYALYEYGHHNCFHKAPLRRLAPEEECDDLICPECGEVFNLALNSSGFDRCAGLHLEDGMSCAEKPLEEIQIESMQVKYWLVNKR